MKTVTSGDMSITMKIWDTAGTSGSVASPVGQEVCLSGASSVSSHHVNEVGLAFCRGCASLDSSLAQYGVFQRVPGDEE